MTVYDQQTLKTTTEMAAVAAFACAGRDGAPRLIPVTPLLFDGAPAFTLTYARSELAGEISASRRAALVFSDSRLAYVGWTPLAVEVEVEVFGDPQGTVFREELLHQELRKFPPARQFADSPILQREHWWYLPRWIVRVVETNAPRPAARRAGPDHGVLACEKADALTVDTVRVGDWDADRIPVSPLAATGLLPEGSPAALLYHDFETPDMDPRTKFLATGRLENGRLSVAARSGSREIGRRPSLLARWRAQRDLERRCRAGLKAENG